MNPCVSVHSFISQPFEVVGLCVGGGGGGDRGLNLDIIFVGFSRTNWEGRHWWIGGWGVGGWRQVRAAPSRLNFFHFPLLAFPINYFFSMNKLDSGSEYKMLYSRHTLVWTLSCCGGSRISQRGTPTPQGAPPYYLAKFSRKLYENEEILAQGGGGARIPRAP